MYKEPIDERKLPPMIHVKNGMLVEPYAKHTPYTLGPWEHSPANCIYSTDGELVADAGGSSTLCQDEMCANARLIAAAPETLNALELAVATIERLTMGHPAKIARVQGTLQVAHDAIAKVKGE